METTKRISKSAGVGDAAVVGLMYGIVAGLAMAFFIVLVEMAAGLAPLIVLSYFDAGGSASPLIGLLVHVSVSGIYGVLFGIVALAVARGFRARMSLGTWLALGILYGGLLFGIAEWIVLPRTASPLSEMPMWALATAHVVYGIVLGGLFARSK